METQIKNWANELQVASAAADLSREILLKYFRRTRKIAEKYQAGLVTEADRESEQVIRNHIAQAFPQDSILGEEEGLHVRDAQRLWLVDPLDGTTNYVHGFPVFCVSIALIVDGVLRVAVIDVPIMKDRYIARAGGGAYKNGELLRVSATAQLNQCLASTGFSPNPTSLSQQLALFTNIAPQLRAIRRPGAAVYDLCMVAEGIFDIFWEQDLGPWDMAAGALLVREAGGMITTYEGNEFDPFAKSILATNGRIHETFRALLCE